MALDILTYKREQGRHTRQTVFVLMACLAWYGATTLYDFLAWDWARAQLGFTIPVVEIPVTMAFLIAAAVFIGGVVLVRVLLNREKWAELLIDTENELKRVTWPSWPETLNGSIVVVVTVVMTLVVLAGADLVLSRFFERIVF